MPPLLCYFLQHNMVKVHCAAAVKRKAHTNTAVCGCVEFTGNFGPIEFSGHTAGGNNNCLSVISPDTCIKERAGCKIAFRIEGKTIFLFKIQ